jgi:hypothetical protein
MHTTNQSEELKGRDNLKDLGEVGQIILEIIVNKWDVIYFPKSVPNTLYIVQIGTYFHPMYRMV